MTERLPTPRIDPLAPWPTLAERDAGTAQAASLYEGVPDHLEPHLMEWVAEIIQEEVELNRRVLSRLRVGWEPFVKYEGRAPKSVTPAQALTWLAEGVTSGLRLERDIDQLTVVDAIVGLHPGWDSTAYSGSEPEHELWGRKLYELEGILVDAGSAWEVNAEFRGLYRRVDATVVEAWQRARVLAEAAGRTGASRYLAQAWRKIYGQHPEPTDGYADAVKAVEAVAVPVVLPDKTNAIVHHVRAELEKHPGQWRFVLVEGEKITAGDGAIDVVATMLNRLLRGETERHGLEHRNRPSSQAEAGAAVQLAVVLVQWFLDGAIQKRDSASRIRT